MTELSELTEAQQQARELWSSGDFPSAARQIAGVGETTVERARIGPEEVVLDVACGAGNATIPAARKAARTVGLDITPQLIEAGKKAAAEAGVEIEWLEGDAQDMPFDDESFDVVLSVFGSMFAPDHAKAAAELARVLKPGGRMVVAAWRPEGNVGRMFATVASHLPKPPEGFQPPPLWGSEDHVREIFDGTGMELDFEPTTVEFTAESADEFFAEFERDLPPIVMARKSLEPEGKWEALRSDLQQLYNESNQADDGSFRAPQEYVLIKGAKAG
jgi:ubiquinone/menaquinone biosynthesis C-methylase UbiE